MEPGKAKVDELPMGSSSCTRRGERLMPESKCQSNT